MTTAYAKKLWSKLVVQNWMLQNVDQTS